jgi:undecaprenyl-diphosphatase
MAKRLEDPRVRLAVGSAAIVASIVPLHRDRVGPYEAIVFRRVNGLPDWLLPPAWLVMQLGTVGAAPAAAGIARLVGNRRLATRLLVGGVGTWAASKVIKRTAGRPRPVVLLPDARVRGREAAGLGYPSGHAGVAVALGTAVVPHVPLPWRAPVAALVPIVGGTRVYVGAHLPLDIVSGAAIGLGIDALLDLLQSRRGPPTLHVTGVRPSTPRRNA